MTTRWTQPWTPLSRLDCLQSLYSWAERQSTQTLGDVSPACHLACIAPLAERGESPTSIPRRTHAQSLWGHRSCTLTGRARNRGAQVLGLGRADESRLHGQFGFRGPGSCHLEGRAEPLLRLQPRIEWRGARFK